ncbi:MAG: nucleoside triphosphate pyrophosphohydrolase [Hyphomicrobium aestuarii]|nr:nucleoside triphosphate pyrophosphohydrolase [Hyphomicrobium aestuarii]
MALNDKAARGSRATLADLVAVMAALRTPGSGCPWDLAQTFETIAPYTIEEAYEVADAIARADLPDLKDELGDLLLQVVYHSRIAEEDGAFDLADVTDAITAKMIRRHPHVFGSPEERATGAAPGFWERIKAEERAAKGRQRAAVQVEEPAQNSQPAVSGSTLDGVPAGLPGLTRAIKLQAKAARVGFDWPDLAPVLDKVREEIAELTEAIETGERGQVEEEFGDLLFVMANVARHLAIDPEAALRGANQKFTRRFAHIEQRLAESGRTPSQSGLDEMDRLWDEAKRAEKRG